MHLDKRLQAVASFVPQGAAFADIGTDHAYLPVWLLEKGIIASAVAGDIAAGPCQAARTTVAMHGAVCYCHQRASGQWPSGAQAW